MRVVVQAVLACGLALSAAAQKPIGTTISIDSGIVNGAVADGIVSPAMAAR